MLKFLGPKALNYITELLNDVLRTAIMPPLWKTGRIVPLLKPNKPSEEGKSYRPVSLLSPLVKLLESLLLPHVQDAVKLEDHQHGFRKGRSCTTALQDITSHIKQGLNKDKPVDRTVLVAVDLTCAFDTVNHEILTDDISKLDLDPYVKRLLTGYLRGRKTFVEFRGAKSRCRQMRQGVPQGGVLSPLLFNLYMSKLPLPPAGIKVTSYADDTSIMKSGPKTAPLCKALNAYLADLNNFFMNRNLHISPAKSSVTLFTTAPQEQNATLPITINNQLVPTEKNPKILGVILDPLLTFGAHTKYLKNRVHKRNNVLKAISGTAWGKDMETINTTYKAIGKSILNYCAPIWTPTLSATNWESLQVAQNEALRTATGCFKMTDLGHLHTETKNMLVKDHNFMLAKQFHLATKKTGHPNSSLMDPQPKRLMKPTLSSLFDDDIRHLHDPGGNDSTRHKTGLIAIHTEAVQAAIAQTPSNKVLNTPAPPVSIEEKKLPRRTRTLLSQLRAGYSSLLQSYQSRINPATHSPGCPKCDAVPHDTNHLFSCLQDPTNLTPLSLWEDPFAAASFLGLQTSLADDNDDIPVEPD